MIEKERQAKERLNKHEQEQKGYFHLLVIEILTEASA